MQITIFEDGKGFYIGYDHPIKGRQRLSFEYWHKRSNAEHALKSGEWYDRGPFSEAWHRAD